MGVVGVGVGGATLLPTTTHARTLDEAPPPRPVPAVTVKSEVLAGSTDAPLFALRKAAAARKVTVKNHAPPAHPSESPLAPSDQSALRVVSVVSPVTPQTSPQPPTPDHAPVAPTSVLPPLPIPVPASVPVEGSQTEAAPPHPGEGLASAPLTQPVPAQVSSVGPAESSTPVSAGTARTETAGVPTTVATPPQATQSLGQARGIDRLTLGELGLLQAMLWGGLGALFLGGRRRRLREERGMVAAALRGELLAARAMCRTRLRNVAEGVHEDSWTWPRIRTVIFQAHVGRIGLLGSDLARQVASVYGQASDYAAYYEEHSTVTTGTLDKRRVLRTLVGYLEEVLPRLAALEQAAGLGDVPVPRASWTRVLGGTSVRGVAKDSGRVEALSEGEKSTATNTEGRTATQGIASPRTVSNVLSTCLATMKGQIERALAPAEGVIPEAVSDIKDPWESSAAGSAKTEAKKVPSRFVEPTESPEASSDFLMRLAGK